MKTNFKIGFYVLLTILFACVLNFAFKAQPNSSTINGAWKLQNGTLEEVLIFNDGYFMHTTFDKLKKQLIQTRGGAYKLADNQLLATIEFNPQDKSEIGETKKYSMVKKKGGLELNMNGKKEIWTLVDNGKGEMVGTWRISGRMQDGKVVLSPPRARKTLKILSGSRFQWAAINAETKEFFGTGGGSYTYANGKYTETLEFFSKDSTRVGSSLIFDGKVEGDLWHHSGLSSQGVKIYEIWKMEAKQ